MKNGLKMARPIVSWLVGCFIATVFLFLYLQVIKTYPASTAIQLLETCTTNATSRSIIFNTAPVSYFELIILASKFHLTSTLDIDWLITLNSIFVALLLLFAYVYFDLYLKRVKGLKAYNLIVSAILATYLLNTLNWYAFQQCGTGTSIIGFSMASSLLVIMSLDFRTYKQKDFGKITRTKWLYALLFAFAAANFIGDLLAGFIHLEGLIIFVILFLLLDTKAKQYIILWLKRRPIPT